MGFVILICFLPPATVHARLRQLPNWLQRLFWLPIWAVSVALLPTLPQDHPWRHPDGLTLHGWIEHGTLLAMTFNLLYWECFFCLSYLFLKL